jgi:hypothetical protein
MPGLCFLQRHMSWSCLCSFGTFSSNICNGIVGLSFRIGPLSFLHWRLFGFWAYLMKVIQETRRDIYIFIQIVMVNNSTKRTITSQVGSSWRGVLDTTLCNKVCQWLATGRWFSPHTPVSSTNTTCLHDIADHTITTASERHEKDMKRKVTVDNVGNHAESIWFSCSQRLLII